MVVEQQVEEEPRLGRAGAAGWEDRGRDGTTAAGGGGNGMLAAVWEGVVAVVGLGGWEEPLPVALSIVVLRG